MPSSERNETIFGLTEKEVKFLLMSLKCIEDHSNRRFVSFNSPTREWLSSCYHHDILVEILTLPAVNGSS